ncbi:outer membrane receptor protein involved in Fe transport [Chitinophaga skermanii]|uniref:Outer membrane receptor protein involved in Fe transport n=1 Tax=Chitinophaga skermanii TaxID=331697 RepID=A0A327R4M9_9BACT|nr:outer membrane beta-barrel family protein [Chitinophaga skermanii]RAJ08837.1 outer membrane receptor protein involved in Fe transport [Chitinophaga skermanii]
MKTFFISLFFLMTTIAVQAQVKIAGKVVDSTSNTVLPFASIQITTNTQNFQTTADENGVFTFNNMPTGMYKVAVQYIGYKAYLQDNINIQHDFNLTISIAAVTKTLKGVEVTGSKPFIVMKNDKIVVNVAQSPITAGQNVYETLLRAPGVTDGSGLKFRSKTLTVYINDRPTRMSGEELKAYLASMPANTIESIEVIPNPSAKYEAQDAAIVNIVLAKDKNLGTNGTVTAGVGMGRHPRYNGGLSLNYRSKKVNVYGSLDYMNTDIDNSTFTHRYLGQGFEVDDRQFANDKSQSATYKVGFDYTLSKKSSIGAMVRGVYSDRNREMENRSMLEFANTNKDSSSVLLSKGHYTTNAPNANIYYKTKVGKAGNDLNINADYFQNEKTLSEHFRTDYFDGTAKEAKMNNLMTNNSPGSSRVSSISADYTFHIKKAKFETGVRSIFTKTDNDAHWENFINGNWEEDLIRNNRFIYKENIYAGYVNMNQSIKKFDFSLGLRAEYTQSEGHSVTLQQTNENDYLSLFPTLGIYYNQSEKQQWSANYSRKIERFGFSIVNPFIIYQSQYAYYKGNPNIRPTFSDNFELGWTYNNEWMASVAWNRYYDVLANTFTKDGDVMVSTYENMPSANQVTMNLAYSKSLFKNKVYTSTTLGGIYAKYNADAASGLNNSTVSLSVMESVSWSFAKNWKSEVNAYYQSPLRFGAFDFKDYFIMSLGVSKTILDKKGTISFNVSDIFNTAKQKYASDSYNAHAFVRTNPETRIFRLVFSYRFGNQQVKAAKARRTVMDDVKRRMND